MSNKFLEEVLAIANDSDVGESGGGHGQKGMEFQKHWAIQEMFKLQAERKEFLMLFETLQDIAILDSAENPNGLRIAQIKKKDRNDWGWNKLTNLHLPPPKKKPKATATKNGLPKKSKAPASPESIKSSPLGKLYETFRMVKGVTSTAWFISNMPSDIPLADGGNVATSLACSLDKLDSEYTALLIAGLSTFHLPAEPAPDLSKIFISKAVLPPDDPRSVVVGKIYEYLKKESPRHAAQAGPLLDALLAQISPLGAKTDKCHTFSELRKERGYDSNQLRDALGQLENVPDALANLEAVTNKLQQEGMDYFSVLGIRAAAASYFRNQLVNRLSDEQFAIGEACEAFISERELPQNLYQYFETGYSFISLNFPSAKKNEIMAILALKMIDKCLDLN